MSYERNYSGFHQAEGYAMRWSSEFDRRNAEELWAKVRRVLGEIPLPVRAVLEIGCAGGWSLAQIRRETACACAVGVDVRRGVLGSAAPAHPELHFVCSDCLPLPFPDHSFELVFQFVTFSSIPDQGAKVRIGAEILRVLRPGGVFLWYDFRYPNPRNPFTTYESRARIRRYFPAVSMRLEPMTVIPHLGRKIIVLAPRALGWIARVPLLRSHYFGFFRKENAVG